MKKLSWRALYDLAKQINTTLQQAYQYPDRDEDIKELVAVAETSQILIVQITDILHKKGKLL